MKKWLALSAVLALAALGLWSRMRVDPRGIPSEPVRATPPIAATSIAPTPAEMAPPVEPDAPIADEPTWDGEGEPSRDYVRAKLGALITARFADRQLSSGELESVVDAALDWQIANRELSARQDAHPGDAAVAENQDRARRAADTWRAILETEPFDLPRVR